MVAAAAIQLGVHLGTDLNRALDNVTFTLLFKDQHALDLPADAFARRVRVFQAAMTGRGPLADADQEMLARLVATGRGGEDWVQHQPAWLAERARVLQAMALERVPAERAWGWKEPNTQIVLERLLQALPGLRYVHVSRNALDMAFSRNTNQLMFWGPRVLGRRVRPVPRDALSFWCELDRRIRRLADAMGDRFLRIDHDVLCARPADEMARLAAFLGAGRDEVANLVPLVTPPSTVGRHRDKALDGFAPDDLAYLAAIGQDGS